MSANLNPREEKAERPQPPIEEVIADYNATRVAYGLPPADPKTITLWVGK